MSSNYGQELKVDSKETLEKCKAFYSSIGFKLLQTTETCLMLQRYEASAEGGGFTLRLELGKTPGAAAVYTSDKLSEVYQKLIEKGFKANWLENDSSESAMPWLNGFKTFKTIDPMGNCIYLTEKSDLISSSPPPPTTSPPPTITTLPTGPRPGVKSIGVLTSGGDSSGMNAAVRSIVRMGIAKGCNMYTITDGYQGLVEGNFGEKPMIVPALWNSVRGYLKHGGTLIGSARCKEYQNDREARKRAVYNLVINGIDALVVIGGDGSLTGADKLREEWSSLLGELVESGKIDQQIGAQFSQLTIVGLVGSIDNDMPMTDITIGAVTALHRICEAVDCISSTALSHHRAFVIEVMGRNCGWLALMAGIATGADYVFLPENPPPAEKWETNIVMLLKENHKLGKHKSIVIVAEGAVDSDGKTVKASQIKDLLNEGGFDTRITILGHVQRGGTPCAFDRFLGTYQGVAAVEAVLKATDKTRSPMIALCENEIYCQSLQAAVEKANEVKAAMKTKDYDRALELRDPEFKDLLKIYKYVALPPTWVKPSVVAKKFTVAIMHVGAPAGGMNTATRVAVRGILNMGHEPLLIYNGFKGLMEGDVRDLRDASLSSKFAAVHGWAAAGGSELGTNRIKPSDNYGKVAYQLQKYEVDALLIIGGFEGYESAYLLQTQRHIYPAYCIPIVCLPATISNNVPGTDYSLGSDTALNAIVEACDRIKQSATASRKRVFVVEVHGARCGYLSVMSALMAGANNAYIHEIPITLAQLDRDSKHLVRLYKTPGNKGRQGTLVIKSEDASGTFSTKMLSAIFKHEAAGVFDSKTAELGHAQQGGTPSPMDRIRATRLAARCVDWILDQCSKAYLAKGYDRVYSDSDESVVVIGVIGAQVRLTPLTELWPRTDVINRRSKDRQWWMEFLPMIKIFSKYGVETDEEESVAYDLKVTLPY